MAQQTNPVNDASKQYKQGSNTFPAMSYEHFTTGAYADVNPFFVMETVEGDSIPLHASQEIRTHTLQAPLMSKVDMKKDYYHVPMRAILPNSWELIYANPTQGDDVPEDANCCVKLQALHTVCSFPFIGYDQYSFTDAFTPLGAANILKMILVSEYLYSNGSLLSRMGYRFGGLFKYFPLHENEETGEYYTDPREQMDFDQWFDQTIPAFLYRLAPVMKIGDETYAIRDYNLAGYENVNAPAVVPQNWVSLHRFVELMRSNPDFTFTHVTANVYFNSLIRDREMEFEIVDPMSISEDVTVNLARVLAYQLVCAHYFTDDRIDFVYSADLYRQTMYGVFRQMQENIPFLQRTGDAPMFEYNGKYIAYDTFSQMYFDNKIMLGAQLTLGYAYPGIPAGEENAALVPMFGYLANVFSIQKSLRFGDYFTGARPSPLAVGDVNTAVTNDQVSTIDLTKNLLMQRFLNHVNRVGRKFSDYVRSLSGKTPPPPVTDPVFLAHTEQAVTGFEVENTAENQGNIVTLLKTQGGEFAFNWEATEPGVLLGLFYFESKRIYSKTIDRFAFKRTRFDMFNKFMQYAGDQAIERKERNVLAIPLGSDEPFAYTLRHMEYKQRVSIATAGFVKYLPGYAFITDNEDSGIHETEEKRIGPDYIRSCNAEFDRYYKSLTNVSLAGYMHFIIKFNINCPAQRQMDFDPSIL